MQGQHPHHCKCSPGTRWELGLLSAAELVSLPGHSFVGWYCGIVGPVSKGSPASPAAGTGETLPRLSLCSVGAGRQG